MLQASGSLHDPILIIGGAGEVGRWATRFLREQYPDVPILIGGRDEQRAIRAAAAVDGASAVVVDLTASDLGLGEQRVSAVATLFTDKTGAALRWAQQLGVGHVNISPSISELGLETATFMQRPTAAPVVLGTEGSLVRQAYRHSCSPENLVVWKTFISRQCSMNRMRSDLQRMQILSARCMRVLPLF